MSICAGLLIKYFIGLTEVLVELQSFLKKMISTLGSLLF